MTYLDDELLISRDESGCAEVLLRKQAARFSSSSDVGSDKDGIDGAGPEVEVEVADQAEGDDAPGAS